ncbi:hypothetical protein GGR50DRAFT_643977 [Xylaria sp. CBS 124048]|nr:hypothetical protein GGR50DRAFT_643977 [Xylaria sp. CBS 124048]
MASGASSVAPATYEIILTWIVQQRRAPEPLTDRLRTALLNLEYAVKAESPGLSEPDLGDMNWVGLLQEYRDVHPIGAREDLFTTTGFDPTGRGPLRWVCHVTLAEEPRPTFPMATDGPPPSFARKKDAKKYAAKCAIEWLQEQRYMPQNGVRFPKPIPAILMGQRQQTPLGNHNNNNNNGQPNMPMNTANGLPPSSSDDTQLPLTNRVAQLCNALGFRGPTYKLESPNNDGLYRGCADFGDDSGLLPFDVSRLCFVENAPGQKVAKEMIAKDLLPYLLVEQGKRENEFRGYMASSGGTAMR